MATSTHTIEGQPTTATMEARDREHTSRKIGRETPFLLNVFQSRGSKRARFSLDMDTVDDALTVGRALCLKNGMAYFLVLDRDNHYECIAQDWVD